MEKITIGEKIKKTIERLGMSQKELAEKMYVTAQAVSNWTRNIERPSRDNIEAFYEITGVDLIQEQSRQTYRSKLEMEFPDLKEIDNYEKAKEEAKKILDTVQIERKYSYSVYKLCTWLLPAVIALTYHQMLNRYDVEMNYDWIFTNLADYLDNQCMTTKKGLYENHLEYSFYLMGADLFESFDEYTIPDDEYCHCAETDWYRFKNALGEKRCSPLFSELRVAIAEIAELDG